MPLCFDDLGASGMVSIAHRLEPYPQSKRDGAAIVNVLRTWVESHYLRLNIPDGRLEILLFADPKNDFRGQICSMTNLASAFKAEMARMARKELRSYVDALEKTNVAYRSEIAALKKRADSLEREVKRLSKALPKARPLATNESESVLRFSPKGLASHRERLGLSAADAGLLLGASGQSVYNWEAGTSRPHADHLEALGAFRKLGRRAAAERLEELKQG